MSTAVPIETSFQHSLQRAQRTAGYLLRSDTGAHTSEDIVSILMEKALRNGKSLDQIQRMLESPRSLANIKNDIYDWETARKRGSGEPPASFEEVEPFFIDHDNDNPESQLIRKEELTQMHDLLTRMIDKAQLSDTQQEILNLDRLGWNSKQIARHIGIDVDTVYARRSEALRKLSAAARHILRPER